jgi:N,N-dimethylformamidase
VELLGYCDPLCAQPGETVSFMVSCGRPAYSAEIVRLIHGDQRPEGQDLKTEPVKAWEAREVPGRWQELPHGSYVIVPDDEGLRTLQSFTAQAWIYPTTPAGGLQGLLAKWDAGTSAGYALCIGADGAVELRIGAHGPVAAAVGAPLRPREWYFVAGAFDADSRIATIVQRPVRPTWAGDESVASTQAELAVAVPADTDEPLRLAALGASGFYNGKIDNPCLLGRALTLEELDRLEQDGPAAFDDDLIAAWDFSQRPATTEIIDVSGRDRHGRAVNMPTRAVTGRTWNGRETSFLAAPEQYSAVHFHDDDLDDSGWDVGFTFTVPEDLRSGIYAARLSADGPEDFVPFFVRPPRGGRTERLALLVPTFSYLAYCTEHVAADHPEFARPFTGLDSIEPYLGDADRFIVEHRLLSVYDRHTDGSGNCYSSHLRPLLGIRPNYRMPIIRGPHQLNADLCLVDWLEQAGYAYDTITDHDLHGDGLSLLQPYKTLLTGGHPEYWSLEMLDALEAYLAGGGRLMYLGANGFYWVTSLGGERGHVVEVRRGHAGTRSWESEPGEDYHSLSGQQGGLWRHRGRAPQRVAGVGFAAQGGDRAIPFRREADSRDPRAAFIFEGVSDGPIGDFGLILGGAAGYEIDRLETALGTPAHTLVLASASGFSDCYQGVVEDVQQSDSRQSGTVDPAVRADMVYFETPNGGAVFSTGSCAWVGALSHNAYENDVARITANVLDRFLTD